MIAEGSASDSAAAMQAASAETTAVEPSEPELPAATLASATELEPAPPAEVAAEPAPVAAEAVAEAVASSEAPKTEDHAAATELPAAVAEIDAAASSGVRGTGHRERETLRRDAEVMAAIASLAPSNGQGSESTAPSSGANGTGQEVAVGATSVVAAEAAITGPRWIAESVAVAVEESAATLDQEMERASAASAAAESAASDLVTAAAVEVAAPAPAVEPVEPAIAEAVSVTEAVAATEPVSGSDGCRDRQRRKPGSSGNRSRHCSRLRAHSAERRVRFRSRSGGRFRLGTRAPGGSCFFNKRSRQKSQRAAPVASVEVAPQREAELAAAWQNWKQIRESFVSTPPAAPAAEAPRRRSEPRFRKSASRQPGRRKVAEAEPETAEVEAAPSEAPGESTAIASIVDTMLAELRPKLVEEIAKKMSSEKKEKEREKEKEKKRKR